jgi:hypothetical protein
MDRLLITGPTRFEPRVRRNLRVAYSAVADWYPSPRSDQPLWRTRHPLEGGDMTIEKEQSDNASKPPTDRQ